MTNTDTANLSHIETYKGRQITVVHRPRRQENYSSRAAGFEVFVEGRTYQGGYIVTERYERNADFSGGEYASLGIADEVLIQKAIKKGRSWVDARIADEEIRPACEASIAYLPRRTKAVLHTYPSVEDYAVGTIVWFFSRGNFRRGVVEKVGKTNVGVAYATEKGGIITRKSLKPAEVGFDIEEVSA